MWYCKVYLNHSRQAGDVGMAGTGLALEWQLIDLLTNNLCNPASIALSLEREREEIVCFAR
jgi:hypothetical protein